MVQIVIEIGRVILNIIYFFIKLLPTTNKITFISRQSNEPSMEFQMIRDEIDRRNQQTKVVMLCRTLDGGIDSSIMNKLGYCFHMLVQMYHLATSKVVVLDTYCIVASLLSHKKSLKIIQMWHSIGSMKLFGYTSLGKAEGSSYKIAKAMRMHENYDYVFAAAEAYKTHLANGFNCDVEKVITMPLPRVDLLKSKSYEEKIRKAICDKYPVLQNGKKTILYCPTFRKDEKGFAVAVQNLYQAIDLEKYNLVVKMHPLSHVELSSDIVQAKEFTSFDMLFMADYVISDYSCIVYEAGVRNIPLYFYNFDMELYKDGRGFAIDYEHELPGVTSCNAGEIAAAIQRGDYDMDYLKQFVEKYVSPVENATSNIVDFIFQFMGADK